MTPTATYIAEENCLQELPRIPKPNQIDFRLMEDYKEEWRHYNAHLASLRRIPCSPECKGVWQDQQKVVENLDYEVRPVAYINGNLDRSKRWTDTAFPLVPVKSEAPFVWTDELVKEYAEQYRFSSSRISIEQFKYSLTKR